MKAQACSHDNVFINVKLTCKTALSLLKSLDRAVKL